MSIVLARLYTLIHIHLAVHIFANAMTVVFTFNTLVRLAIRIRGIRLALSIPNAFDAVSIIA